MCGIAGFVHREKNAELPLLRKMTDVISHRGPDGEGFFVERNIALGHRRLSIIDLECGAQPMYYDDGNLVLIFNGEIYNYVELRDELEKKGASFTTNSDTEVILAAYRTWGMDCVKRFNGMWAFALLDKKNDRLFCSRDRLGEKPFFYTMRDGDLVFGSEIKSLFAFGIAKEINEEVLDVYLCLTYIPAPYTFFKNIHKLPPGWSLVLENGNLRTFAYWDVDFSAEADSRRDEANIFSEFEELFYDSVRIRMRSDVPFGAFLSGGLDSSSVVAAMSAASPQPVKSCTIAFAQKDYDESELARLVAEKFSTDHVERLVTPEDAASLMEKLAWHYDEPFGDSSALPTYIVSKIARERVTMVLTGDGGDEVLSGYTVHQGEKFSDRFSRLPAFLRRGIIPGALSIGQALPAGGIKRKVQRAGKVVHDANLDFIERIESKQTGFSREERKKLLAGGKNIRPAREFIEDAVRKYANSENFVKLNYWLTKVSLPDDMLCKVDRASMANSLETRVPFLDYRLVELMAGVSMDLKLKGYTRKYVLRQTLGRKLPQELLSAPKRGFAVPLREWFRGDSSETLRNSALLSTASGLLRKDAVEEIVKSHNAGSRDAGNALWSLGMLSYSLR